MIFLPFMTSFTGGAALQALFFVQASLSAGQEERTHMGMWTAIALISIASIICGTSRRRHNRGDDAELNTKLDSLGEKIDKLDGDLRSRVETLEKIVTDRKEDLRRQFDYLDKAS